MARPGAYLLWSFLIKIVLIPSCLGGRCPASWHERDQSCYRLLTNTEMTGAEAADRCHEIGGGLAVPGSQAEQDTIWALIRDAGLNNNVYIGCKSPDGYKANLVCTEHDGKVRSYRHWEEGEPDGGYRASGRCVRIGYSTGKWDDAPCTITYYAMCETSQLQDDIKMPLTCLKADANGRFAP